MVIFQTILICQTYILKVMFFVCFIFINLCIHQEFMAKVQKSKLSTWINLNDDIYLDPDGILGKGCFGQVFRGYSVKRDCIVAIKTMQGEGYEREVETLMTLSSLIHPNIMGYYGFQKKQESVYMFIEFCPNGTLTDLINEGIQQIKVLKLFRQMIQGMCYMNAKGTMHRDLKPDNVLIGLDQDVKISDFGLARDTGNSIFVTGQMGTPLYAGPQVYLNKYDEAYSQKCDVWGAGMILYEMLTQKVLFQGVKTFDDLRKQWHLYEIGEKRVELDSKFHPNWEYFTNFMLTYDPKKRPTFHQVLEKLKKVYDKMQEEIKNKTVHSLNENTKIGRLQMLLMFFQQKYQILLKISENFTQKVIGIHSEFKYIIQFLCICQYLCHIKKLIRNLKYKRIKVSDDDDEELIEQQNQQFDLLLDKYRNLFQHKYNFNLDQIKNKILPKLAELQKKEECIAVVKELKDIWVLIDDVRDGTFDVEQTYNEALQQIMKSKLQAFHKGLLNQLKLQELKVYNLILLGALLQKKFQNTNYLKKNYIKEKLQQIEKKSKEELLKDIANLKKELI